MSMPGRIGGMYSRRRMVFTCGELGHATARCPVLDEFPFLPLADRTDD